MSSSPQHPSARLRAGWPRPTRRVGVHVLLGLTLYGAGANVAAGWVLVLAGLLLGSLPWAAYVARRSARTVEVTRTLPTTATAGLPVEISFDVRARTSASVVVHDRLTGAAGATADPRTGARLTGTTRLRRGITTGGDVEVTVTDPLGLFTVRATGHVPSRCEVLPDPLRGPSTAAMSADLAGATTAAERGDGVETLGLREHVSGDPLRRVHWRSVARRGELVVKETAGGDVAPLVVAIDGGTWDRDLLDEASAVAAGLASSAAERGSPARVVADGEELPWGPAAQRLLAGLPPHGDVPARPLRDIGPQGAVVVTTDGDEVVVRSADGTTIAADGASR